MTKAIPAIADFDSKTIKMMAEWVGEDTEANILRAAKWARKNMTGIRYTERQWVGLLAQAMKV